MTLSKHKKTNKHKYEFTSQVGCRYCYSQNRVSFKLFSFLFLFLFLFFSFFQNLKAQNPSIQFRHLTTQSGLADGWVHDALMDSNNMMWFATHDGLSRYDGHHFKNYKVNNSIPNSLPGAVLMNIKEGKNGIFWIACNGMGLVKFDSRTEMFYAYSHNAEKNNSISHNAATSIYIDKDESIWVGTFDGGLNLFDEESKTFTRFPMYEKEIEASEGFMKNSVRHIISDPLNENKIWIATHDGIVHFDKKSGLKTNYYLKKNGEPAFAVHLLADDFGTIWVGTENHGLIKFDSQTKEKSYPTGNLQVKTVLKKSDNELWIATIGKGIGIYNTENNTWQYLTDNSVKSYSILSNDVYGIYIDSIGRMWVRDMHLGISVSNGTGNLFQKPILPDAVKSSLVQIKKFAYVPSTKELFVTSTASDEIFLFQKNNENYVYSKLIPSPISPNPKNNVLDIFVDAEEQIWILIKSENSIEYFKYEKSSSTFLPVEISELKNLDFDVENFATIAQDKNGTIWLAFSSGTLLGIDEGKIIKNKLGRELEKNEIPEIWDILFDKKNNLWAASLSKGIFKLNLENNLEEHFPYKKNGGLEGWRILSIAELKSGKIWVGTSAAGIQEIDPGKDTTQKMIVYNQFNGLYDDKISGLDVDDLGNVWISTMRGLIKYNSEFKHFKQLGKEEGLENTFLNYGFQYLSNGDIVLGQPAGFQFVSASKTNNEPGPRQVYLSSFLVNGKKFQTEENLNFTKKIELYPNENYFTFQFSANDYDNQGKIKYRYVLENYDNNWITSDRGIAVASFTNVPPGSYTFKVQASNTEGNWNGNPTSIAIKIHPPWYWSNFMKFIYALLLIGIVTVTWILQTRRLKLKNQLEFEKTEATRLKELDELKSRFFANVTHELRTPLTLMLSPISTLLKNESLDNKQITLLKTAQTSGKDLLKLIGSLLDLSKMEGSKMELEEKPELLFPLVRRIVSNFESHAQRSKIKFTFEYKIDQESQFEVDKEKIKIILNNLLSNAIKFTPNGGEVNFVLEDLQNKLQFSIQDTGRGIHENDIPHVFDRFYQSRQIDVRTEGGTGIGLAVSREFIKLMNGKIWVESELGKGSKFIFQIPRKEILGSTKNITDTAIENEILEKSETLIFPKSETRSNGKSQSTILIVEDNYSLRNYLELILSPHYNTISAENGQQALDILSESISEEKPNQITPNLVLSDIMMPVMDGYQLSEILKSRDYFRNLPLIMLTARADFQDRMKAFRIGVDDYLLKPFEEEELIARINNLLKNYSQRKSFQSEKNDNGNTDSIIDLKNVVTEADQQWLEELEKLIIQYISDSRFNTEFLANQMSISRRQLQRKTKAIVGLTPKEYINEIRLHEARTMMESGKAKSVNQVAKLVGFSNAEYFSSQFKERFGKVPSAYLT